MLFNYFKKIVAVVLGTLIVILQPFTVKSASNDNNLSDNIKSLSESKISQSDLYNKVIEVLDKGGGITDKDVEPLDKILNSFIKLDDLKPSLDGEKQCVEITAKDISQCMLKIRNIEPYIQKDILSNSKINIFDMILKGIKLNINIDSSESLNNIEVQLDSSVLDSLSTESLSDYIIINSGISSIQVPILTGSYYDNSDSIKTAKVYQELIKNNSINTSAIKNIGKMYTIKISYVDNNNKEIVTDKLDNAAEISLKLGNNYLNSRTDKRKFGICQVINNKLSTFYATKVINDTVCFKTKKTGSYLPLEQMSNKFKDMSNDKWASDYVDVLAARNIANGISKDKFNPRGTVTRAEFAAFVARALNLQSSDKYMNTYTDIKGDEWYALNVEALNINKMVDDMSSSTFRPNDKITREEMATIIMKAYEKVSGESVSELAEKYNGKLNDLDQASPTLIQYIKAANYVGIISGDNKGNFNPKAVSQRSQAAKVIVELLNKLGYLN